MAKTEDIANLKIEKLKALQATLDKIDKDYGKVLAAIGSVQNLCRADGR